MKPASELNGLLVDDVKIMLKKTQHTLKEGFGIQNFQLAFNGQEAWDLLSSSENKFDFIITDINMPEVDGFELIKRIQSDQNLKGIPLCVHSAIGATDTKNEVGQLENVYVVEKPMSLDKIKPFFSKFVEI